MTLSLEEATKHKAQQILSLPEIQQHRFFETYVACHYWHGLFLKSATERSKKAEFTKWRNRLRKLSQEN